MSFYGTIFLSKGVQLEKRRFGPNNTLRFGNVLFAVGYNALTLENIEAVAENEVSVLTGPINDDVVTVAVGPKHQDLTNFRILDATEEITLEENVHCVVLEGVVSVGENTFSAGSNIPYFVTLSGSTVIKVLEQSKLLLFTDV
jgi:hypothetical protein